MRSTTGIALLVLALAACTVHPDGDTPEIEYSEVTLTQWEPEERTY